MEKSLRRSLVLLWPLLLLGCTGTSTPEPTGTSGPQRVYVLALTDTTTSDWYLGYRQQLPEHVTLAVSGYPGESQSELLARLPWLLQPGVDTLRVDPAFIGYARICDSVAVWSPSTVCHGIK